MTMQGGRWNRNQMKDLKDKDVVDSRGEKIGTVDEVFLDAETDQPEWIALGTGILGMQKRFVPVEQASIEGEQVRVPYEKDLVKEQPDVEVNEGIISVQDERRLCEYFGVSHAQTTSHRTVMFEFDR